MVLVGGGTSGLRWRWVVVDDDHGWMIVVVVWVAVGVLGYGWRWVMGGGGDGHGWAPIVVHV